MLLPCEISSSLSIDSDREVREGFLPEPGYDDPKLLFIPIKLTLSLPVVEAEFISVMVARDYLFPILEGGLDLIERGGGYLC